MKCMHIHASAVRCAVALALAASIADAQVPSSAFGAPSSSLHGGAPINPTPAAGAPAAPAWTPRNAAPANNAAAQPSALQQANLPADLAKLNDTAIIIIGGKPTAAGDVKRAVLALDDKAKITVAGRQVAAAEMKGLITTQRYQAEAQNAAAAAAGAASDSRSAGRQMMGMLGSDPGAGNPRAASARAPLAAATASQNAGHANAPTPPHVKPVKVPPLSRPIASPKRVQLIAASQQLRNEQDRLAQVALTSHAAARIDTAAVVASAARGIGGDPHVTQTEQVPKAGIFSVNNHTTTSPHLTPGGKVGIWGMGFGPNPGTVKLVGGVLDRSPINLQIARWTNDTIEAAMPGGIRGVPDVNGAVLQVTTSANKSYRFDNVSFVAAREEQPVTDPQKIVQFVQGISSSSPWTAYGQIGHMRFASGKSIDCPGIGSDTVHFKTVGSFDVVGAAMSYGRTDSGDGDADGWPGSRVFSGTYAFGAWVNQDLQVNWGVFRSHTSPRTYISFDGTIWSDPFYGTFAAAIFVGAPPVGVGEAITQVYDFSPIHSRDSYDECQSGWVLTALTVWGPAGVAP